MSLRLDLAKGRRAFSLLPDIESLVARILVSITDLYLVVIAKAKSG
jgi:hypothetical protein